MDEEEYDALTEEEKIAFNREVQQALRERKKRLESQAEQFPRSNFHGAHPPSWGPGSSSRVAAMATGDQEDDRLGAGKRPAPPRC